MKRKTEKPKNTELSALGGSYQNTNKKKELN